MAAAAAPNERCVECGSDKVTHRDDKTNEPLCRGCITFEKPPPEVGLGLFERHTKAVIALAKEPVGSSPDTSELLVNIPAELSLWLVKKAGYSQHSQAFGVAFRALLEKAAQAAIAVTAVDLSKAYPDQQWGLSDAHLAAWSEVLSFIMENWDMDYDLTQVELEALLSRFQQWQLSETRILRRIRFDENEALLRAAMFGAVLESAIAKIGAPKLKTSTFLPPIEESIGDSSSEEDDGGDYQ